MWSSHSEGEILSTGKLRELDEMIRELGLSRGGRVVGGGKGWDAVHEDSLATTLFATHTNMAEPKENELYVIDKWTQVHLTTLSIVHSSVSSYFLISLKQENIALNRTSTIN